MWKQTYPCFFSGNLERRKTAAKAKRNISKRENCMTFYKEHYVLAQVKCYYLHIYICFYEDYIDIISSNYVLQLTEQYM